MLNYLFVFIGGGLGSICRYGIAHFLSTYKLAFPWATLAANILSCLLLGIMVGLNMKGQVQNSYKMLIMVGFCGGFSTFSTFSNETFQLFQNGAIFYAFGNILLSLIICLSCIYVGMKLVY